MKHLYHTTSWPTVEAVLRKKKLGKRAPFVSFSEIPLFGGDISYSDVALILDAEVLRGKIMKVVYDRLWYDTYPDHAAYIAGEGWQHQYTIPEECFEYDEETGWEEEDEECVEESYRDAEYLSFEFKEDEREWISKREGQPVAIPHKAIVGLLVPRPGDQEDAEELLADYGLKVPVYVGKTRVARVAALYVAKVATRPIPVDKGQVRDLAKGVTKRLGRWFRVGDLDTPVKDNREVRGWPVDLGDYQTTDVGGRRVSVPVWLTLGSKVDHWTQKHQYIDGGKVLSKRMPAGWSHKLQMNLRINGNKSPREFLDNMDQVEREAFSVLLHEVTHLRDYSLQHEQYESGGKDYYNDPVEVRAYMAQIVDELEPRVMTMRLNAQGIETALIDSPTWAEIHDMLTPESRKTIIKGVTRALQDARQQGRKRFVHQEMDWDERVEMVADELDEAGAKGEPTRRYVETALRQSFTWKWLKDQLNAGEQRRFVQDLQTELGKRGLAKTAGSSKWPAGIYLHGAKRKFDRFRFGPHGVAYFSDPASRPGMKTQAEHIAEGPFGGWLAEVRIKKGKEFNPYRDPVAEEILRRYVPEPPRNPGNKRLPYEAMPEILQDPDTKRHGYTWFKVWEPSVHDYSFAVADPSMIEIVRWHRVGDR